MSDCWFRDGVSHGRILDRMPRATIVLDRLSDGTATTRNGRGRPTLAHEVVMARPSRRISERRTRKTAGRPRRKWSKRVTQRSDALDLQSGVFKLRSSKAIAASLKRSALRSRRRKSSAYRSAMSMLTFYINRAGRNLPASRKRTLARAKDELRAQFGRDWVRPASCAPNVTFRPRRNSRYHSTIHINY
jgi:hypothetical protein